MLKVNLVVLMLLACTTLSSGEEEGNIHNGLSRRQLPPGGFRPYFPPPIALPVGPAAFLPACPPQASLRDDGLVHGPPNNGRPISPFCGANKYGRKKRNVHEIFHKAPQISKRVIGGVESPEGAWPWTVSLIYENSHTCGGSLITNRWVLTAAHCVDFQQRHIRHPCTLRVQVGENNIVGPSLKRQVITVSKIITHPAWNQANLQNDIALLRLSRPVILGPDANVICLPSALDSYIPATCTIIGWGEIFTKSGPSSKLLHLNIGQMHPQQCNLMHMMAGGPMLPPGQICINTHPFGDSCQGDSGGPMVCQNAFGKRLLIGLSSYSTAPGCGGRVVPSVYTDVKTYRLWIEGVIFRNGGD